MTRAYNELVGVLATFSRPARSYRIDTVYRIKKGEEWGDILTQYGIDWVLLTPAEHVENGLMDAYASALHSVYVHTAKTYRQMFLQLVGNQTPDALRLPGPWSLWAQM
jgi:hypothetical protein